MMEEVERRYAWVHKVPRGATLSEEQLTKVKGVAARLRDCAHPLPRIFGDYIEAAAEGNIPRMRELRKMLLRHVHFLSEGDSEAALNAIDRIMRDEPVGKIPSVVERIAARRLYVPEWQKLSDRDQRGLHQVIRILLNPKDPEAGREILDYIVWSVRARTDARGLYTLARSTKTLRSHINKGEKFPCTLAYHMILLMHPLIEIALMRHLKIKEK